MWWGHHDPVLQWWVLKGRTLMSAIAVKGTSVVDSLCGSNVALATNFRADVPVEVQRGGAGPAGLALSALDSIVPIDRIESDSLEFPAIDKLVSPMFSKMESDIWKQDVKSEGHAQSPKLIAVHASNLPGSRRVFAFRAQRNLKALGTTSIVGWIYRDSTSKLTVGEVRGYQADPDGKGDTQLQPDAVFTVQGHTFWLGRTHGYEDSGYFVMEVGGPKTVMVLQVDAGGC